MLVWWWEGGFHEKVILLFHHPLFYYRLMSLAHQILLFWASLEVILGLDVFGVGLKKDFTVSIIPSPYMCFFIYFPSSGLYFLLNSDCRIILSIELY